MLLQAFFLVSNQTQGFLLLNLKNHKIDFSINVIFYETSFPYHSNHVQNNDSNSLSLPIP